MSKRITTRWYMGAWLAWLLAVLSLARAMHGSTWTLSSVPTWGVLAYSVLAVTALVMLVMWAGALIKLVMLRSWGWLAVVLILHLIGLGIIGMVAYAVSGPNDHEEVVYRPTAT